MILAGLTGWKPTVEHDWSPMVEVFVSPMAAVSKGMFFEESDHYNIGLLFLGFIMHYSFMVLCNGLGIPMGLFVPSILVGSIFGRIFGEILLSISASSFANPGVYALLGAASMMSGVARITISMSILMMETTGGANLALPLFIATLAGKFTGDRISRNVYDVALIELNKVPILEPEPETEHLRLQVKEVMPKELVTLDAFMTIGQLIERLQSCKHNGFPVLDLDTGGLVGLAHRGQLLLLLKHLQKAGLDGTAKIAPFDEFVWAQERSLPELEAINAGFSQEQLESEIDLGPYLDKSGYSIPYHASVASCYTLFRKLGLRHLPVLGKRGVVVGIITRKDLILDEESHAAHAAHAAAQQGHGGKQDKTVQAAFSEDSEEPISPHAGYRRGTQRTEATDFEMNLEDGDAISKAEATAVATAHSTARSARTRTERSVLTSARSATQRSKESKISKESHPRPVAEGSSIFGCLPRMLGRQAASTAVAAA